MRNAIVLVLLTVFTLSLGAVYAQNPSRDAYEELSRTEKKKWKKVAKDYKRDPVRLKVLTEEHAFYKKQNTQLQNELSEMEGKVSRLERTNASLETEMSALQLRAQELEAELRIARESRPEPPLDTDAQVMGIVFKVQIGAYQNRALSENLVTSDNLNTERDDSVQKIVVGQFRDYAKAKELRDQLRAMGVKDAWVVSYRDGVRISIEEALKG